MTACSTRTPFDYQSECHCSKTNNKSHAVLAEFDYQSECHCSKTAKCSERNFAKFDYQSECHCSKTKNGPLMREAGLTTSQNVTAPKRSYSFLHSSLV